MFYSATDGVSAAGTKHVQCHLSSVPEVLASMLFRQMSTFIKEFSTKIIIFLSFKILNKLHSIDLFHLKTVLN